MVTLQIDSRVLLSRPRLFVPFFGEWIVDERRTPRGFVRAKAAFARHVADEFIHHLPARNSIKNALPATPQLATGYFHTRPRPAYASCGIF